jgi:hypothetical protein
MPDMTSAAAVFGGRDGLQEDVKMDMASVAARTGGPTGLELPVEVYVGSEGAADAYKYRHWNVRPQTRYQVELRDRDGRIKWADDFNNLVTTEGLNTLLDATFKTGIAHPAWFIGLVDGDTGSPPEYGAGDTMPSHGGWSEFSSGYDEAIRQAFTVGSIAGGSADNGDARAVFTFTGNGTIAGCFLTDDDAKGETDGLLYGVGAFSGGDRAVEDGDTLRVTTTLSASD